MSLRSATFYSLSFALAEAGQKKVPVVLATSPANDSLSKAWATLALVVVGGLVLLWKRSRSDPKRTAATPKAYVGCNWKCSLEKVADVDKLIDELNAMWRTLASTTDVTSKIELCVNPPYVFVDRCRAKLCSSIRVGSQNVFDANGPNKGNTAATTANMLASVGVEWVLLGHADRRNTLGETDALIADKVKACIAAGLGVNLTIGDLKSQRDAGLADATLTKQLGVAAGAIPADAWGSVVVAYEPVWAVGDGATPCSPEEAQRVNSVLRKWIATNVGADAARACRLTYTGSVSEKNAADYAGLSEVDGFVVGRAGLDVAKLGSILKTLAAAK